MLTLKSYIYYKTRDGRKAFVGFIHPHPQNAWPCHGYIEGEFQARIWERGGRYVHGLDSPVDIVAEWTEPKLRPFRLDEVPLGTWLTMEGKPGRYLITGAREVDLVAAFLGFIGYEHALNNCKHSLDNGKTWLPCGVKE